ncbi:hypothetical protein Acj133p055 [Acinetobacter phage 133]|uniref:Uncharacterized protein n=1 Tax=Acinetobacter phage 133 TaxID=2919552 RepID=D9I621_9CAUD|nr:hypothetical protein Acj133p055 [Acinetobacter phage 133]ADJ19402.1 hypothetical protein Acj133p055 [Acinetobacter phage 133]
MTFHDLNQQEQQALINAKADLILKHEPTRGYFAMHLMSWKLRPSWIRYVSYMGYYNISDYLTEYSHQSPFFAFAPYSYQVELDCLGEQISVQQEDPLNVLHQCDARFWARFLILNPEHEPSWLI